jgi:hypothetical protein
VRISNFRRAVAVCAFAIVFAAIGAGTALAVQSHMVNARADLNSALTQLNQATPDKAGHRVNAINLVKQAIGQVNAGISAAQ